MKEGKIEKIESREDRIEKIKEKIINIEKYRGLIHFTHPGNIEGILKEGLIRSKESSQKYSFQGSKKNRKFGDIRDRRVKEEEEKKGHVSYTIMGKDSSFSEWESVPWGTAIVGDVRESLIGPLCLLFDHSKLPPIRDYNVCLLGKKKLNKQLHSEKKLEIVSPTSWSGNNPLKIKDEKNRLKELSLSEAVNLLKDTTFPFPFRDGLELEVGLEKKQGIPKEAIIGIVVSPLFDKLIKNIKFNKEQNTKIAINRMNRVANNPEANLVPIYDNDGNVLWPENISHQEVKEMLENKDEK